MPSTRELRRRIRSIKSTRQITKAMELISSSRMRRASSATLSSRPYSDRSLEVLADLLARSSDTVKHPLLHPHEKIKNVLAIVIASDKGLAGVYNVAITKKALAYAKEQETKGHKVSFITIGKKATAGLIHLGLNVIQSYPQLPTHPVTGDILPLAQFCIHSFETGDFDQVDIVYTEFYSMLRQDALLIPLLPLQAPGKEIQPIAQDFVYEPDTTTVLNLLLPRLVEVEIYQAVLESLASEHAARRMAMKNASDNASEMIDDLTLTYNGVRQGAITQELAEITSGAAALE